MLERRRLLGHKRQCAAHQHRRTEEAVIESVIISTGADVGMEDLPTPIMNFGIQILIK
jgi:hypothetical protein